jgi:hypothetical protein
MHVQLASARSRVLDDLARPDRPADEVNDVFDAAIKRFESSRVQSFVPILVERAVRARFAEDGVPTPRSSRP